jgi:hypothetical protein
MDSVPAILTVINDLQGEQNMGFGDTFKLNERGQPGKKRLPAFLHLSSVCCGYQQVIVALQGC